MKRILISMLLSAAALTAFTTSSSAQQPGDEAAVLNVVNATLSAFDKRDLAGFAPLFVKSPYLYYQINTADGEIVVANGWEAMSHMVDDYMNTNPEPAKVKTTTSDPLVHVNGNTAWINYTTHWDDDGQKHLSRDFIVLEKQAGQWKIAALTSQHYQDGKLIEIK